MQALPTPAIPIPNLCNGTTVCRLPALVPMSVTLPFRDHQVMC